MTTLWASFSSAQPATRAPACPLPLSAFAQPCAPDLQTSPKASALAPSQVRFSWRFPLRCRGLPSRRSWQQLAGQTLVGDALTHDGAERIYEARPILRFACVESVRFFVQVSEQVEGFDGNIGSLDGALQQRPEVFQPVSVDVSAHIGFGVINDRVNVGVGQAIIGLERVGVDVRTGLDVRPDFRRECDASGVRYVLNAHTGVTIRAVAFQEPHDGALVLAACAGDLGGALVGVHEARFSTDERFIGLDLASELVEGAALHGEPDAVQHEPCGLLGDMDPARDLIGTDPVLRVADQPHSREPLVEADRRILEDGPDLDGELLARVLPAARPHAASLDEGYGLTTAGRAGHPVRPAQLDHEGERLVRVREVADRVHKGRGGVVGGMRCVHAQRVAWAEKCVKYIITLISVPTDAARPSHERCPVIPPPDGRG